MPTTLSFTHTLPPQLTHYFSGDLGTLSLGIPYNTCNAQRLLEKLLFFFFFQSYKMDSSMSTETATTVSRVDAIASNLDQFFLIVMGCLIFCKYFSDHTLWVLFLSIFY